MPPPLVRHPRLAVRAPAVRAAERQQAQHAHRAPRVAATRRGVAVHAPDQPRAQVQPQRPPADVERQRRRVEAVLGVHHEQAQHDQAGRARQHVALQRGAVVAARLALRQRERDRHAHDEQEGREHDVDEAHRIGIGLHVARPLRHAADAGQLVDEHHHEDREAAERVDRDDALARERGDQGRSSGFARARVARGVGHSAYFRPR